MNRKKQRNPIRVCKKNSMRFNKIFIMNLRKSWKKQVLKVKRILNNKLYIMRA